VSLLFWAKLKEYPKISKCAQMKKVFFAEKKDGRHSALRALPDGQAVVNIPALNNDHRLRQAAAFPMKQLDSRTRAVHEDT
jgi:hypothetical protein